VGSPEKAGAKDGIGASLNQWLEQRGPVRRTVLEVSVLNYHDVAVAGSDRCAHRCAFAKVSGLIDRLRDLLVAQEHR
jgi:hypothetical protein